MPDGCYTVQALILDDVPFSVTEAIEHFRSLGTRSEPEQTPNGLVGFRVFYGEWSIVAWLDDAPHVPGEIRELYVDTSPPFPPEILNRCSRRLSIWSDEDYEFEHTNEWIIMIEELQEAFGLLIRDDVVGEWWDPPASR
ncbi:MAG TPA: hypothetical protein VKT80_04660 [Chloroflexota bacterium]|nr:hypothetical protein [Chloroflexota bacterium]